MNKHQVYRLRHPDRVRAMKRRYRASSLGRTMESRYARSESRRLSYQRFNDTSRARAARRAYYLAHKDKWTIYTATRRANKRGRGLHTTQEWLDKCALLGNVCIYCGEARPLTRDHKLPIVRGGTNDITNIVPACASCNRRKYTMTASEFIAARARGLAA